MGTRNLHVWVEGAIIAALAMALQYVPHSFGNWINISWGIIPVAIYSFRRGPLPGCLVGLVWGMLDLFLRGFGDGGFLNPIQGILEYPIAFGVVGLIGFGSVPLIQAMQANHKFKIVILAFAWTVFGVFVKYTAHFFAGVIFWGAYAKGMNPWLYSLFVNGGSAVINVFIAGIIVAVLALNHSMLFFPKDAKTRNVA